MKKLFFLVAVLCIAMTWLTAQKELPASKSSSADKRMKIFVLFPHSMDAQQISVVKDSEGRYIYQEDVVIDSSQIITDTSGNGGRKVDYMLRLRRAQAQNRTLISSAGLFWDYGIGKMDAFPIKFPIACRNRCATKSFLLFRKSTARQIFACGKRQAPKLTM